MSTFTRNWSEEKIRAIIRKLDEKTGLDGASLPINFSAYGWFLGLYRYVEPKAFSFNRKFFDNPNTKEAEVIDVIRHEYAHYYVDVANLAMYIGHSQRETSHGADWKWACKMVGADPTRCHNAALFSDIRWSAEDALNAYNANDIIAFDILSFIKKWHRVPMDKDMMAKMSARIKARNPNAFYDIGDEVLHPKKGFGFVQEAIPNDYWTQDLYIQFEDRTEGVFNSKDVCKIVAGKAVLYHTRKC